MIRLVDHDNLESLLRGEIDLLRLRDLLEQLLHHDPVVVAHIGGGDLEVVDRGDDVEIELAVAGRLEDSGVDLDLFDSRTEEFLEGRDDAGFLARA